MSLLRKGEYVITAWAEPAAGPGWCNAPVCVLLGTPDGTYRKEVLQPEDQTAEMIALYSVSAAASGAMTEAVRKAVAPRARKR